jgi:transcriptional regulator with XRE-family HTH domain
MVSPPLTPEQRKQIEKYASGTPHPYPDRPLRKEPPITDPQHRAAVHALLFGGRAKVDVSPVIAELGRLLKAERERQGLSLAQMSERCGVEKGAISRLENGLNANPTLETLLRCAQALGKGISLGLTEPAEVPAPPAAGPSDAPQPPAREFVPVIICKASSSPDAPYVLKVPAALGADFDRLCREIEKLLQTEP